MYIWLSYCDMRLYVYQNLNSNPKGPFEDLSCSNTQRHGVITPSVWPSYTSIIEERVLSLFLIPHVFLVLCKWGNDPITIAIPFPPLPTKHQYDLGLHTIVLRFSPFQCLFVRHCPLHTPTRPPENGMLLTELFTQCESTWPWICGCLQIFTHPNKKWWTLMNPQFYESIILFSNQTWLWEIWKSPINWAFTWWDHLSTTNCLIVHCHVWLPGKWWLLTLTSSP